MKRKIIIPTSFTAFAVIAALFATFPQGHAETSLEPVPESWRGRWQVTVEYRDRDTGSLTATDITTTSICPGEPIVPTVLSTLLHVSGESSDNQLRFSCNAKHSPVPGCNIFVEADLDTVRNGDDWTGTGSWNARSVGACEHLEFGENIVVTGRRIGSEVVCDGAPRSLVQRVFPNSGIVPAIAQEVLR